MTPNPNRPEELPSPRGWALEVELSMIRKVSMVLAHSTTARPRASLGSCVSASTKATPRARPVAGSTVTLRTTEWARRTRRPVARAARSGAGTGSPSGRSRRGGPTRRAGNAPSTAARKRSSPGVSAIFSSPESASTRS